jgi:hypothetical protein
MSSPFLIVNPLPPPAEQEAIRCALEAAAHPDGWYFLRAQARTGGWNRRLLRASTLLATWSGLQCRHRQIGGAL